MYDSEIYLDSDLPAKFETIYVDSGAIQSEKFIKFNNQVLID